jgi:hypothetical protein
LLLRLVPLAALSLAAQTHSQVGWYVYNGDHAVSGRWGIHFDIQPRFTNMAARWRQLLVRPGVNFQLTPNLTVMAGYAFRNDWFEDGAGGYQLNEQRLHQQIRYVRPVGPVRLQQRGWIEERWLQQRGAPGRLYFTRFRYMLHTTVPLRGPAYLAASAEPFWRVPARGSRLEQHRTYLAAGRRFAGDFRFEAGYQHQWLFLPSGNRHVHVVVLTLFSGRAFSH